KADAGRLFPDAHLQVNRVQGMDAQLTFTADTITAGAVPFTHVSIAATLKDGVLSVHPARFDMPQGRLSGVASIDTHPKVPSVHMDVRATDVELEQVKGKAPTATPPLGGIFEARAIINGKGDSIRSLMASANGTVTGVIPHGDVRAAFAELTGVDVAAGVGLLLKKPDDRAAIRCGLAQFDIQDGTARADSIVMDTQNVLITGGGQIELGSEKLDLAIEGHPKKLRLVRVRSPIKIKGHVLKPTFELDAGHLAKQGGIAAALGSVLTPLAAILAFVDPGLAKDQNCAQLSLPHNGKSASNPAPASSSHAPEKLVNNLPAP
ncbi:MAG TPA: AsmA-like C-terminal region-containing protein, partial [Steroidobacteraceae bacterium]|nr:AsmA-like C-terminal region-containing protein [Steroidobacteraceae bacterium]